MPPVSQKDYAVLLLGNRIYFIDQFTRNALRNDPLHPNSGWHCFLLRSPRSLTDRVVDSVIPLGAFVQNEKHFESEWQTAWSKMQHRKLDDWNDAALREILSGDWTQTKIVDISITDNPPQFSDRVFRNSRKCPSCGVTVGTENCLPISLYPTTQIGEKELTVGFGCWMHAGCFCACTKSSEKTPIPW